MPDPLVDAKEDCSTVCTFYSPLPCRGATAAACRASREPRSSGHLPRDIATPPSLICTFSAAKLHPGRTYYYRPGDVDALLGACGRTLASQPGHLKALFTRAACLMKKREYGKAIEDYSVVSDGLGKREYGCTRAACTLRCLYGSLSPPH